MHPIVIIGSGMAGYTLAREFRKLNPEQELVMICADDAVNCNQRYLTLCR